MPGPRIGTQTAGMARQKEWDPMSARTRFALSGPGDVPDGREETVGGRVAAAARD